MGKKRKSMIALLLGTAILLQGCEVPEWLQEKPPAKEVYTVIAEDPDTYTYTDGVYEIVVDKETGEQLSKKLYKLKEVTPSLYLMNLGTQYSIEYVRVATYNITYQSLCGYVQYLQEKGYEVSSMEASDAFIDVTLKGDGRVRIIYTPSLSNIFYCDSNGNFSKPPYLNRKE